MPQHRFASIHVVGTNGKSSVTRMTAALLEAHGMRTGAYLSPHLERWSERVLIDGAEIADADSPPPSSGWPRRSAGRTGRSRRARR